MVKINLDSRRLYYPRSIKTFIECEANSKSFDFFKGCFFKTDNFYSISKTKSQQILMIMLII